MQEFARPFDSGVEIAGLRQTVADSLIATALELFHWCPFKRAAGSGDALPFGSNRNGCH
jgi:hypothetical protein